MAADHHPGGPGAVPPGHPPSPSHRPTPPSAYPGFGPPSFPDTSSPGWVPSGYPAYPDPSSPAFAPSGYPALDFGGPGMVPPTPVCPGAGLAAIVVGGLGLAVAAGMFVLTVFLVTVVFQPSSGGEWDELGRAIAVIAGVVSTAVGLGAGGFGWAYVQVGRRLRAGTVKSFGQVTSLFITAEVLAAFAGLCIALVGAGAGLVAVPVLALLAWPHIRMRQELAATRTPPPGTYPA